MKNLKYIQPYPASVRNGGFTLLELLVAIFITTLVVSLVTGSFFQIINAKEKVESELEKLHEARVIFTRISKDLANVYPRGAVSSDNKDYPYIYFMGTKEGDNSRLQLSSFTRDIVSYERESDQSEVTYFLEILDEDTFDEEEPVYALVRRENPWFGNESGGTQYAISEKVSSFKINYLNKKPTDDPLIEEKDIDEWDAKALGGRYPKAVEIELVLIDDEGQKDEYSSIILLPIAN